MPRSRPRVAFALACALVLSAVGGAPALAANTRTVFFGSPGTTTGSNGLGVLTTTSVTAGGATATDVILTNLSPSELTHVVIQGGDAAPDPLANPSFPAPSPICTTDSTGTMSCIPSLPPGTTYLAVYADPASTAATSCSSTATSLTCTVANMSPNQSAHIRVVIQPPAAAVTGLQFWLATSLKEGTSNAGSNQDTFFALGTFDVLAAGCGQVSTFFKNGDPVTLSNTAAGSCAQAATVSTAAAFPLGAFELVGDTGQTFCAPGITSCFGEVSRANVNFGAQPAGTYVLWDIVWTGADLPNGKPKGVTHFLDTYPTDPTAFVNISFKQTTHCATAVQTDCWVSTSSTKTSFEAIFRTPNNGYVRGF